MLCQNYSINHVIPSLQEHVEGYHELTAKTKTFFSMAVAKWDAEFYVKVDDDVHVNLGLCSLFIFLLFHSLFFYIVIRDGN